MSNTLTSGEQKTFQAGDWCFSFTSASSGTATFSFSQDNGATFVDIDNGAYTATATPIIKLPECLLKVVLTGDMTDPQFSPMIE